MREIVIGSTWANPVGCRLKITEKVSSRSIGFLEGSDVYRARFLDGTGDETLLTPRALDACGYRLEEQ